MDVEDKLSAFFDKVGRFDERITGFYGEHPVVGSFVLGAIMLGASYGIAQSINDSFSRSVNNRESETVILCIPVSNSFSDLVPR